MTNFMRSHICSETNNFFYYFYFGADSIFQCIIWSFSWFADHFESQDTNLQTIDFEGGAVLVHLSYLEKNFYCLF